MHSFEESRRRFLLALLASPVALALVPRLSGGGEAAAAGALFAAAAKGAPPTPECADDDDLTPPETAGPFFKPRSPERDTLLEKGIAGTPLVLSGRVFGRNCKPLAGVLLDFWQADDEGEYDNEGYRLRGHQYTDAEGRFRLSTVVPGLYPGRTRHIHVRVQPKGGKILTTQLYVPGEGRNQDDFLFREELLMTVDKAKQAARFNFILDAS